MLLWRVILGVFGNHFGHDNVNVAYLRVKFPPSRLKNSRLPFHAPVLRSLDLRPFQTAQLSYLLKINLVTATSYDIKTARNNIILLGQIILLL